MALSEEALENDRRSGLPLIKVSEIYADKEFNCRGQITASDVVDLVRDTATRGLVEPVIIRELWENEKIPLAQGFKYSLIAGFRRHFAYRINQAELIPCVVRKINSIFECQDINAVENLQRQNLNMLQEAHSIRHYIAAGWTREMTGKRVSKSPGWVQAREELLNMPEEIQLATAQGYLTGDDLKLVYKHRGNKTEMLRLAGIIRDRRKSGQKRNVLAKVKIKKSAYETKKRKGLEVEEMMEMIREMSKKVDRDQTIKVSDLISEQGNSALTRILAWTCGNISNLDVHTAVKQLAKVLGCSYDIPEFTENFSRT